jgi:hypothetical protein
MFLTSRSTMAAAQTRLPAANEANRPTQTWKYQFSFRCSRALRIKVPLDGSMFRYRALKWGAAESAAATKPDGETPEFFSIYPLAKTGSHAIIEGLVRTGAPCEAPCDQAKVEGRIHMEKKSAIIYLAPSPNSAEGVR